MQTSSRRSFMSTAAVAATASLPGCMTMAPAAASIRCAAPYISGADSEADDPVFAAIARWRPLQAAVDAAMATEDDALIDVHYGPASAALTAIYETEPTTPDGLLAILVVMREQDSVHLDCETLDSCCDDLRRGLFRAFQSAERLLNERGRS
ncbi:hypothetical protein [Bosea sp. (in: a-proteobacteria)]|uniref:hypothetical protein n=1 Tax=Bosea sp. (in: a-proteobacteria) TaxID=1871050 RepID=UPI002B4977F9|nr:hypothetical protein [Bosea sp. (in: a-proteobacteria)]WRH56670.1 MAG: hypothetical protein RSE11_16710 [Bosea sp. (in: a-proteobacteria)]